MCRALVLPLAASYVLGCDHPPPAPPPPRPVLTVTVAFASGRDTVAQTGDVQPRRETELGFPLDGRIVERRVEVGARVTRGVLLARLDGGLVDNEVHAADADLGAAIASQDLATSTLARLDRLFAGQSASAQQLDEARAAAHAAGARREVAAAAALNVRRKLAYTRLVAPEDGVITAVGANAGQVVAPGQMVVRLATPATDAVFTVSERVATAARTSVPIRVRPISDPARVLTGEVREISPVADPVTHTYRVRVELPADAGLPLGASVTGELELPAERVVALPASALTRDDHGPAVFVVDVAAHQLRRRAVSVARFGDDRVVISGGLHDGDRVVVAGVSKLRPDEPVGALEEGLEKGSAR